MPCLVAGAGWFCWNCVRLYAYWISCPKYPCVLKSARKPKRKPLSSWKSFWVPENAFVVPSEEFDKIDSPASNQTSPAWAHADPENATNSKGRRYLISLRMRRKPFELQSFRTRLRICGNFDGPFQKLHRVTRDFNSRSKVFA